MIKKRRYNIDIKKPEKLIFRIKKINKRTGVETEKEILVRRYTKLDLYILRLLTKPMSIYDLRLRAEKKIHPEDINTVLEMWIKKCVVKNIKKPIKINGRATERIVYETNFTNKIPIIL